MIEVTPAMIDAAIEAARQWLASTSYWEQEGALESRRLVEKMLSAALDARK